VIGCRNGGPHATTRSPAAGPFTPGDPTYRVIPSDTPAAGVVQSHTSIGFDRVPLMRDVNVSFSIDRLRELVGRRALGGLAPNCYSWGRSGTSAHRERDRSRVRPPAARRGRGRRADHADLTILHAHRGGWPARWRKQDCADDLKALYYEAFMAGKPAAGSEEIARWFWGETAMGGLLRRVRDRLDAAADPAWKAAAFGVAR